MHQVASNPHPITSPNLGSTGETPELAGLAWGQPIRANLSCGARTRACRVATHGDAARAGPPVFFSSCNQTNLDRVVLYVSRNPVPLRLVPDPVVVRFALPEWLPSPAQHAVCFPRRAAFQRLEQAAGWDQRQQQNVDLIGHHDVGAKLVVAEAGAPLHGSHDQARHGLLAKIHRTGTRPIQWAVNPDEGLASRAFVRRRVANGKQAAVEAPGDEQPPAWRVDVRQAALCSDHSLGVRRVRKTLTQRRHEWRRGTHECVRHSLS